MRTALATLLMLLAGAVRPEPYAGHPIVELIDELRASGVEVAYSSNLLSDDLLVLDEPDPGPPVDRLRQVLQPHGLSLIRRAGVWLVVRDASDADAPAKPETERGDTLKEPAIDTILVSASRYEIAREIAASRFDIDRLNIETLPTIGDDPLRAVHRLPGAAASGASAKMHLRGGNVDEVGIVLNGQRLFDPFHVRDYQSIFSAVDSRAIEGVEVYTGGFPARYGDRIGGYVLMESRETEESRHTELGLSVFNTSVLSAGRGEQGEWLVSARRGNLDLVIDPKYGKPRYSDLFAHYEIDVGEGTRIAFNALYADDAVSVVLETDPDEREAMQSDTQNAQFWAEFETAWSDRLTTSTLLSAASYRNLRQGETADEEKLVSTVSDRRKIEQVSFRQDWRYRASDRRILRWGVQMMTGNAEYDYAAEAAYFGLPALYVDQPATLVRAARASPDGGNYAAYVEDRWKLSARTSFQWGLRWDDQTYKGAGSDAQLSPRLSLLHRLGQSADLRMSWGRYHQSQGLHELQIEDGVTRFWPAQSADHWIVGLQTVLREDLFVRVEAFHKRVDDVRPRFENLFDPLALVPELQPDRVEIAPSRAQSSGVELSIEQALRNWHWWASYTWSRAQDRVDGRDEYRSWDQRHALQAGLRWRNERWTFSAALSAHSGWPSTNLTLQQVGSEFVAVPGPRNANRYPSFASLDLRVSRKLAVAKGQLTVFAELSNATNRRNRCCIDWDVETDGAQLVLENSADYWLPRLPAIGILWEF